MHAAEKTVWFAALAQEARRDLLFAWNVARGSFSGPKQQEEVQPALFVEAVEHLLAAGCRTGFGDPDSDAWKDLPCMSKSIEEKAKLIAEMWASNRREYEFLVFAIRP
jgi:hypothetical protein